jgi:peptidoglycan/LPS O-acetylase OafA/YrhL
MSTVSTLPEHAAQRLHELDWLRVMAIILLLYFHVGMIFVGWPWHIKNAETSGFLELVMAWLHQWRMPLLLFISGAGTRLALGHRTPREYIKERHRRLLVPLIFGMFVVVPPQIYFERIDGFGSYLDFYPTVFRFVPYPLGGSLSWHHLWFVLYLLLYSVLALPFFLYLRSPRSANLYRWASSRLTRRGALLGLFFPLFAVLAMLGPFFPEETHALVDDWAFFLFYFLFFVFGYFLSSDDRLWSTIRIQRRLWLGSAAAGTVVFYAVYLIPYSLPVQYDFPWALVKCTTAWFWILAVMGYGQEHLRFTNRFLQYANEAIYPFYILHQTVIVAIGYYVIPWQESIPVKFVIISSLSVVATVSLYEGIRRWHVSRLLFGMKPAGTRTSVEPVVPGRMRSPVSKNDLA